MTAPDGTKGKTKSPPKTTANSNVKSTAARPEAKRQLTTSTKLAPKKTARATLALGDKTTKASKTAKAVKPSAPVKSGKPAKASPIKSNLKTDAKSEKLADKTTNKVRASATANKKPSKPVRARRRSDGMSSEIASAIFGEMHSEDSVVEREAARGLKERDLLARLSISMGRVDEMPNLELAADIVFNLDEDAVSTLIGVIERHDENHAPDAARVIAEVGTREMSLLLNHSERLLAMCDPEHKEMLPYTMVALSPVGHLHAEALWDMRDLLWSALADLNAPAEMAQSGAVRLLSALCAAGPEYARTLAGGLVDLLGKCMPKDVAFFAESVLPALGTAHIHRAKPVLDRRMKELIPAEVARLRRAMRAAQTGSLSAAA